jgi:hypothetical protein
MLNTDDRPITEYLVPRHQVRADMRMRLRSLDAVMSVRALPSESMIHYGGEPTEAAVRRDTLRRHQEAVDACIRGQRALALGDQRAAERAFEEGNAVAPELLVNRALLDLIRGEQTH